MKRTTPPLARPGRRVSLTLTVGQCKAIEAGTLFQLTGCNYAKTLKHLIIDGLFRRSGTP